MEKQDFHDRELELKDQLLELMGLGFFFLVLLGSFLKVMFF
jgi:hypothetical protein